MQSLTPEIEAVKGADLAAVARASACAAACAARDPLVLPVTGAALDRADALAIARMNGDDLGVAWRFDCADGAIIDARVHPTARRRGVGRALLAAVAGPHGPGVVSVDAAHRPARRALERLGFSVAGVVFHQRWDGVPEDVAGGFASATLRPAAHVDEVLTLVRAAGGGAHPRPSWARLGALATLPEDAVHLRVAQRGDASVGVVAAHRQGDAWEVDALAVLPEARRLGVGRCLLTDLMRRAAASRLGVQLRVGQANDAAASWSGGLGFWTYRTWVTYRRDA